MPSEPTRLVFGLAMPSASQEAAMDQLSAWMREHASVELERRSSARYEELGKQVRERTVDVAWLSPAVYARLAEAVTPLGCILRDGVATYDSALVVREASELRNVLDLVDVRAGWVDPWSAAGYVVPRIEIARAGVDLGKAFKSEKHFGSHREVVLALQRGDCDVAATYARARCEDKAIEGAWSEIEGLKVRVLATYGPIPADVLVVRRNLEPEPFERVFAAFKAACADDATRPLMRAVFNGDSMREGVEPGHDQLRRAIERATVNGLFD
jgi:phosphate/phosphite/phosphonate ABC transporter binding protein